MASRCRCRRSPACAMGVRLGVSPGGWLQDEATRPAAAFAEATAVRGEDPASLASASAAATRLFSDFSSSCKPRGWLAWVGGDALRNSSKLLARMHWGITPLSRDRMVSSNTRKAWPDILPAKHRVRAPLRAKANIMSYSDAAVLRSVTSSDIRSSQRLREDLRALRSTVLASQGPRPITPRDAQRLRTPQAATNSIRPSSVVDLARFARASSQSVSKNQA